MGDHFKYTCVGRADVKKAAALVCLCAVSCVLFGIASVGESVFSPYFKLAAGAFLLLLILISVRFIGIRYSYSVILYPLGDGDLVINELRGFFGKENTVKVKRTVCRVSVSDIREIFIFKDEKDDKKRIKSLKKSIRKERAATYNYSADVFPKEFAVAKISDGDGVSYIKFSPDRELLSILEG